MLLFKATNHRHASDAEKCDIEVWKIIKLHGFAAWRDRRHIYLEELEANHT